MHFSVVELTQWLQKLRAAHALSEAGGVLCVRQEDAEVLRYLDQRLPLSWQVAAAPAIDLTADHATPATSLGSVTRPLLFPHTAVTWCRDGWADRPTRFSFEGILTDTRLRTLNDWSVRSGGQDIRRPGLVHRILRADGQLAGAPPNTSLWASRRGRKYPVKAWDDRYFHRLCASEFVLCPSGDHIWTYRVFEAALCGAIPVVEAPSPAYGDLVLPLLTEDASALRWERDIAEHNQREATRLITAPHEELRAALTAALGEAPGRP